MHEHRFKSFSRRCVRLCCWERLQAGVEEHAAAIKQLQRERGATKLEAAEAAGMGEAVKALAARLALVEEGVGRKAATDDVHSRMDDVHTNLLRKVDTQDLATKMKALRADMQVRWLGRTPQARSARTEVCSDTSCPYGRELLLHAQIV